MVRRATRGGQFALVNLRPPAPAVSGLQGLYVSTARAARWLPTGPLWGPAHGVGVAATRRRAAQIAVVEALERYCQLCPVDRDLLCRGSYRDLRSLAIAPATFASMSVDQYRAHSHLMRLEENTVIDWCEAYSATRRRRRLIPAAFAYGSLGATPPNNFLPEWPTSGYAAHVSLRAAALAGLLELLERDALALTWHARLPIAALELSGLSKRINLLCDRLRVVGVSLHLFELMTDGPFPVVMAVAERLREPFLVVGCACRTNRVAAAIKAISECAQTLFWWGQRAPRPNDGTGFEQHAVFYGSAVGAHLFWSQLNIAQPPKINAHVNTKYARPKDAFSAAVAALARRGLEVILADITTADVAELGLRVVRVIVPGLMDISCDPAFGQFGTPRLHTTLRRMGLSNAGPKGTINRLPVPLA